MGTTRRTFALALCFASITLSAAPGCSSSSRLTFRTSDGFELEAREFGAGPKGVVLAHMRSSDMDAWDDFAESLADDGYHVITFNFRGHGDSEGRRDIGVIDRDVTAAARHLKAKGVTKIALIGASMGGTASLIAAAGTEMAVATLSAPLSFEGLEAGSKLASIGGPKSFIASLNDGQAAKDAQQMFRLAGDPLADLKLLPGDAHGTDMLESEQGEEVSMVLLDFLERFHA